jgi:F420H(2)-dependent quinone reductase
MIFNKLFKLFTKFQVMIFRWANGKRMAFMRGMPVLLLTTTGRRTGRSRTTPVMYIRDGDNYVVTASNNGREDHPVWFLNIQASPGVTIEVPGKRLQVSATIASSDEKKLLWSQLVSLAPFFDDYRKKTTRDIPMVILKPEPQQAD